MSLSAPRPRPAHLGLAFILPVALAATFLWWQPSRSSDGFTADEERSLATLRVIDAKLPLLAMTNHGPYDATRPVAKAHVGRSFACSLFVATRGPRGPLFGRNFDWAPNAAMLVTNRPPRGPTSVSLVDLSYVAVTPQEAMRARNDPAVQRKLLQAVKLPFDGLNEHGLAIGFAQVPAAQPPRVPNRPTVGSARIQRLVLDQARTVDQAIAIFGRYNVEFPPDEPALHYLLADATGQAAAIEFVNGRMHVIRDAPHAITNFVLTGTTDRKDLRYRTIASKQTNKGSLNPTQAMDLLSEVAQRHTRWSAVYELTQGTLHLTLDRDYSKRHTFHLKPS
ncbi:hypothetical protein Acsp03_44360 [Actinomadura sp. NBRC 104412]|nr:hypothetical protein Acsp03_44360 [Actinomadura sp. NBRC 104412]